MKKIFVLLMILMLIPTTVFAEQPTGTGEDTEQTSNDSQDGTEQPSESSQSQGEQTPDDSVVDEGNTDTEDQSESQNEEEIVPATTLNIDSERVYEGMSVPYSMGYEPTVTSDDAKIVLPLVSAGEIAGNLITASVDLGDPMSAPFVFKNYEKQIVLQNMPTNKGFVDVYYIVFDLSLQKEKYIGTYPINITVKGTGASGEPIEQLFTSYVRITDGKDPNAEPEIPAVAEPAPSPIVIVSKTAVSPETVQAGSEFDVTFTITNKHERSSIKNMTVTLMADNAGLTILEDSSTFFFKTLDEGESLDLKVKYKTDLETLAGKANITAAISYENEDDITLNASGGATVTIKQPTKVELTPPELPQTVNAGDTLPIEMQVMNLSRGTVYNVRCELNAAGLIPTGTGFIGNMEGGTASTADMSVFVGTMDMSEGHEGEEKYGYSFGTLTLIYEDVFGEEFRQEYEVGTTIEQPIISVSTDTPEEEVAPTQWWIALVVGAVVLAGLCAVIVIRNKRRKKFLEEE